MSERVWEVIASPSKMRNYTMMEWFELTEESIQTSPDCFNKFTMVLHKHYPGFLDILMRTCPQSKWPYKELFAYHLENYPEMNDKKLTEASFSNLLKDLDTFFNDGKIIEQFYRKAIFDKAVFYLSNSEYQVFRKMIKQDISEELSTAIFEHIKYWNFSEYTFKHFYKVTDINQKMEDSETVELFNNPMNSEPILLFENPIQYFLAIGKTFFTYNMADQSKHEFVGDKSSQLYRNLVNELLTIEKNTSKNINTLIIVSGDIPIGFISDDKESKAMLNPNLQSKYNIHIKHFIEHMFYFELLQNKYKGFVFGSNPMCIKTIIDESNFKSENFIIEDLSFTTIPMYNSRISILKGISDNLTEHDIIIKTEDLKSEWFEETPETIGLNVNVILFRNNLELFISGEID